MSSHTSRRIANFAVAGVLTGVMGVAAADDTEIFFGSSAPNVRPNILLIIDTSGSMNLTAGTVRRPYNPKTVYPSTGTNCNSDARIYISNSDVTPTSCTGLSYIELSARPTLVSATSGQEFKCNSSLKNLVWGNVASVPATAAGYSTDRYIRWRGTGSGRQWSPNLDNATTGTASDVECLADASVHGNGSTANYYPQAAAANNAQGQWVSNSALSWWNVASNVSGMTSRTLISPNYIRWAQNPGTPIPQTRMDVVRAAAANFISSLPDVNLGIMRYSANSVTATGGYVVDENAARGGMIVEPVSQLTDTKRAALITKFTNGDGLAPYGWTPLSETLFEAYRYFKGDAVGYGSDAKYCGSINNYAASATANGNCSTGILIEQDPPLGRTGGTATSGGTYISPITDSCQRDNFVIYLTDGLPTQDHESEDAIRTLVTNYNATNPVGEPNVVACDAADSHSDAGAAGAGRCLAALSGLMAATDFRTGPTMLDQQRVITHYVGFGAEFQGSGLGSAFDYLKRAAAAGQGSAYQATDLGDLQTAFNAITNSIFQATSSFTSPAVSVNAFNRTQTLNDLYVSVFQPTGSIHWPGNVKKYRLVDSVVRDFDGASAVDSATGLFKTTAKSYWSAGVDGGDVKLGGAASRLPDPVPRNLYTYIGTDPARSAVVSNPPLLSSFPVNTSFITRAMVGVSTDLERDNLVNWARGADLLDEDGNATTTVRHAMGDPVHGQPAVVIYGGTTALPNIDDAVVYAVTNDGYLHAINAATGVEHWAYIPQELLIELRDLNQDDPATAKHYSLDGDIRILKYDTNGDGIVDPAAQDKVYLYVGQGRGGSNYYALDVTDKTAPKMLWTLTASDLPGIGDAWSPPTLTRISVNSTPAQNTQKLVLVFGGGYDADQDSGYSADDVGNHIFMVDAVYGNLLWSAGPDIPAGTDNLKLARMDRSIPSRVTLLDVNSDGYTDRMYAGDMGGQVWRFDFTNGNVPTTLATGGVIASLGARDVAVTALNKRRFYNAPDVSTLVFSDTGPVLNIAIGSGYRGHPLEPTIQDRFYSIRDSVKPFAAMTADDWNNRTIVTEGVLTDVTSTVTPTILSTSNGWYLRLSNAGEKVLATSSTLNNTVAFTTYTPNVTAGTGCRPSTGENRIYAVNVYNGAPVSDTSGNGSVGTEDRSKLLNISGIAPELSFLFLPPATGGASSSSSSSSGSSSGGTSSGASGSSGSSSSSGSGSSGASGSSGSSSGSSGASSSGPSSPTIGGSPGVWCMVSNQLLGPPWCPVLDRRNKTVWSESDAR